MDYLLTFVAFYAVITFFVYMSNPGITVFDALKWPQAAFFWITQKLL